MSWEKGGCAARKMCLYTYTVRKDSRWGLFLVGLFYLATVTPTFSVPPPNHHSYAGVRDTAKNTTLSLLMPSPANQ